jgi:hypothetical protein
MIVEYTIGKIKEIYDNNNYNEDIDLIETRLSDKIDEHYVNSPIIHIFPIIISGSITLLLATYLLVR